LIASDEANNNTNHPYLSSKTNLGLLEQEIVSGSGISWAICKPAPRPRQITTPASNHLVFTALCTMVQSVILRLLVVCLSVCLWRSWIRTTLAQNLGS